MKINSVLAYLPNISSYRFIKFNEFQKKIIQLARLISAEFRAVFKTSYKKITTFHSLDTVNPKIDESTVPVIFIHGFLASSVSFIHMKEMINQTPGFENYPLFFLDLPSTFQSIKHSSMALKKKIQDIKNKTGCKEVIIVGHSMGGVIAMHHAQFSNDTTIKKVVTISTPLLGTKNAHFAPIESAKEMRVGSEFTTNLRRSVLTNPATKYFHIGNTGDAVIIPNDSTYGGDLHAKNVHVVSNVGHVGILQSREVADLVTQQISAG